MGEWKEVALNDVCEIVAGFAFKGEEFGSLGENVIKIKDIKPPIVDVDSCSKVDMSKYSQRKLQKYLLEYGDFVIAMTGATIGKVGLYRHTVSSYINQRVAKFIPNNSCIKEYLYYCLCSTDFNSFIINNIDSNSAQENISTSSIANFKFPLPPLPEQRAIAAVLGALDAKIDLLHRQNRTLEDMAQTLFRQWFVEEAKEEWEEGSLLELINLVGGGTPKTDEPTYWDGEIPWLAAKDITTSHQGFAFTTEKNITVSGLQNSSTKLLPKYAMVISARGTVGKYTILSRPMAFSQSNYGILPKIENTPFFTFLAVIYSIEGLKAAAYGSIFDTITTTTFREMKLPIPPVDRVQDFEKSVGLLFYKQEANEKSIRHLQTLRDTLLPKLLSGEVRVAYSE